MKTYDIFLGRSGSWYALRVAKAVNSDALTEWLSKGYRIHAEHQIGIWLHEVYLVKAK